jgi:hypothetical protein
VKGSTSSNWSQETDGGAVSWSLPSNVQTVLKNQAVDQALKIIESRIDLFGVSEPTLQRYGSEASAQILLQMPGVDDPERVKRSKSDQNRTSCFDEGRQSAQSRRHSNRYPTREAAIQSLGGALPPNRQVWPYNERPPAGVAVPPEGLPKAVRIVEYPPVLDGSELRTRMPCREPVTSRITRSTLHSSRRELRNSASGPAAISITTWASFSTTR